MTRQHGNKELCSGRSFREKRLEASVLCSAGWTMSDQLTKPSSSPPTQTAQVITVLSKPVGERLRDKRKRWDNFALLEEQRSAARVKFFYHCLKLCGSKIDWIDRVLKLKRIYLETSCPLIIQQSFKIAYADELKTPWISWSSFVSCFFCICC